MSAATGSLWRDSAAESFAAPPLEGPASADLAILGGGFTGLSAALEAAGQGARVVLLEAETVGHGGSGRNVGLVNAGLWLPPDAVSARLGPEAGEKLNAALAAGPDTVFGLIEAHGIACAARRAGTLHLAHAPAGLRDLQARHTQLAARDAPVTLLDAAETARRTGTGRFCGALHDARAGTLQPLAYVRGLARAAAAAGATIHEGSPALRVTPDGDAWHITTPAGDLHAARLLVATNAYHRDATGVAVPRNAGVNFFQLATAPLGDNLAGDILPGGEGAWDTGLIMTALRRDAAGRVILGGMGGTGPVQAGWARRKLRRLYPRLAGVEIVHQWAGRIAMTGDHLPRILRLDAHGLAVFGYSGRGIAPGTLFGRACAQALLTDDARGLPLTAVDNHAEPWPRLRSVLFEAGAQTFHLLATRR